MNTYRRPYLEKILRGRKEWTYIDANT
jgi:hypothetical protein